MSYEGRDFLGNCAARQLDEGWTDGTNRPCALAKTRINTSEFVGRYAHIPPFAPGLQMKEVAYVLSRGYSAQILSSFAEALQPNAPSKPSITAFHKGFEAIWVAAAQFAQEH